MVKVPESLYSEPSSFPGLEGRDSLFDVDVVNLVSVKKQWLRNRRPNVVIFVI